MGVLRLVDVGARDGIDPRWRPFHSELEVIAFEPDPDECARLRATRWPYAVNFLAAALGAKDGENATLHICRQPGCSSLLRPNLSLAKNFEYARNMEIVAEVPVVLSRLDTVVSQQPDVIKLDTQGTELDILEGAGQLLNETLAVEIEVEFISQYEGQHLFSDVDIYMRSHGFTLRGLRRTYWRNTASYRHPFGGQIIHGDVLYLRPELMDCPKGHLILAAYRQYDLLAQFGAWSSIPEEPLLIRALGRLLSGYPNRTLRRFVDRLCPASATDWHDPDFF